MLIKNAKIFTLEDSVIENGWLLTQGKIIEAIGEMGSEPDVADETYDAQGGILLPGFIDAHTHLGMWEDSLGFEGDDGNEDTDPCTPQLRATDAANPLDRNFDEALTAGVTTVVTGPGSANAIGGMMAVIKTYGRRIDDMIVKDPISMKFALGENPKTVYHGKNETPVTRMATAALIREQLLKAKDYLEKLEKSDLDEDADKPEFDIKCEAMLPVLKREIQAHFHAHRADDIFTALRISKEFNLDCVIVHCTEGHLITDELVFDNVKIFSGPFFSDRCKPELSNLTPACPGILNKAGLNTAIITDHPVTPIQYLPICAGLAVREGMEWEQALKSITIYPARILGLDSRIGSLRSGKDADLVIYSGDPLSLSSKAIFVAVNGKRVK